MTSEIKVVILYLWLGGKDKRKGEREMMKKACSWNKMLKESKSYKEMLNGIINVDEVEKYMMEKGWTGKKNLDRMELKKEIYKKVGNEAIWRINELYKYVLDGVDWGEYENGYEEEWDVAIGMKIACMLGWSWDLEEED